MAKRRDKIILTSSFEREWLGGTKPMTRAEAWIRLLIECNNGDYKRDGVPVVGVAGHSQNEWADIFRWSRERVRSFFGYLEKNQQITKRTTKKTTYIKVMVERVYEGYQPTQQPTNQPIKHQQNRSIPESVDQVCRYFIHLGVRPEIAKDQAELFYNHHKSKGWKIGKSQTPMADWKSACVTWKSNMDKSISGDKPISMDRKR